MNENYRESFTPSEIVDATRRATLKETEITAKHYFEEGRKAGIREVVEWIETNAKATRREYEMTRLLTDKEMVQASLRVTGGQRLSRYPHIEKAIAEAQDAKTLKAVTQDLQLLLRELEKKKCIIPNIF